MIMSHISQEPVTTTDLSEVNGQMECIGCKKKTDNGYSFACNHTVCKICQPVYDSVCPICGQGLSNIYGAAVSVTNSEIETDVFDENVIFKKEKSVTVLMQHVWIKDKYLCLVRMIRD